MLDRATFQRLISVIALALIAVTAVVLSAGDRHATNAAWDGASFSQVQGRDDAAIGNELVRQIRAGRVVSSRETSGRLEILSSRSTTESLVAQSRTAGATVTSLR